MNQYQILNVGSLNLDYIYTLEHELKRGETQKALSRKVFAGGKGLNQSIAMARAGLKVVHVGKTGTDGNLLRRTLEHAGVDTRYIMHGDGPSGHAVIQVDNATGSNSIILYPGTNHQLSKSIVSHIFSEFPAGTLLVLQNETNDVPYIMQCAKQCGFRIAINPSPCTEEVKNYPLELAEFLFLNEIEAEQLTGESAPDQAANQLCRRYPNTTLLLTLGSRGALYAKGEMRFYQKAIPAKVVDTTGAGDTFNSYFLASVLSGMSVEDAMMRAARAAAITVSRHGSADAIPTTDEVDF